MERLKPIEMMRLLIGLGVILFLLIIYRCQNSTTEIPLVEGGGDTDTTRIQNTNGKYVRLEKEFQITALDRTRKIWLYLPPDYESSSTSYPVIYMQDGQNLFDKNASFAGEWEIDETMDLFFQQNIKTAIVVGIENDGANRINEYSPYINANYNKGGEGDAYVDFIVDEVKPYIDTNYRSLRDATNTGIGGSSMGALISLYAAVKHQNVFGKAILFSPSFWFTDEIFTFVEQTSVQSNLKIYMAAGRNEDGQIAANTERMQEHLSSAGFRDVEVQIDEDGYHGEGYWARAFPLAYRWLFID